ncbi:hypothetical protein [Jannaschia donghaensis]|uniref:Uncharacterized protein n=1 Tax=Jannaschia donghaensis TaxID=420998 RepID=A0A0M6YGT5_9RHOB|nr:hypothetical protein [Jannaschia donghaensis]CTQ48895.1 hypothetical protein JDO7802_00903 [Jannaschia donghaensis]
MKRGLAGLAVVVLAACQPTGGADIRSGDGIPGLSLVPAPGGLMVAGSGGREIGFGRDRIGALQSMGRIEGRSPQPVDCPAPGRDAFDTTTGLRVIFEGEKFVGWTNGVGTAGRTCV